MKIASFHRNEYNAPGKTMARAEQAKADGYVGVQTGYEPQTRSHVVTAEAPPALGRALRRLGL
jgi:hypothetical protein